jgi:hypothetical protein
MYAVSITKIKRFRTSVLSSFTVYVMIHVTCWKMPMPRDTNIASAQKALIKFKAALVGECVLQGRNSKRLCAPWKGGLSAKKSPYRHIAGIWAILETLCTLNCPLSHLSDKSIAHALYASDSTAHEQLSSLVGGKKCGKKLTFGKVTFQLSFRQYSRNRPQISLGRRKRSS